MKNSPESGPVRRETETERNARLTQIIDSVREDINSIELLIRQKIRKAADDMSFGVPYNVETGDAFKKAMDEAHRYARLAEQFTLFKKNTESAIVFLDREKKPGGILAQAIGKLTGQQISDANIEQVVLELRTQSDMLLKAFSGARFPEA